eukprot:GGOE01061338.1.p1 GENE.GGOE01061338.1~~GGOE01061338.1.p1  ORF type:complete len:301 (-),score=54.76 GGOE01061338.1:96-998(-)
MALPLAILSLGPWDHLLLALLAALGWHWVLRCLHVRLTPWLEVQPWLPQALRFSRQTCYDYGFPREPQPPSFPEGVTDAMALEMLLHLTSLALTDGFPGLMCLPVVLLGWEHCGVWARAAFVLCTLLTLGHSIEDFICISLSVFAPDRVGRTRYPVAVWILMCVFHHPLVLLLIIPLNLRYLDQRWYHCMYFYFMVPSALCTASRLYKMTLDTTILSQRWQFRALLVVQFTLVALSRGIAWGWYAWVALMHAYRDGATHYLAAGLISAVLMSVFNRIVVLESSRSLWKEVARLTKKPKAL